MLTELIQPVIPFEFPMANVERVIIMAGIPPTEDGIKAFNAATEAFRQAMPKGVKIGFMCTFASTPFPYL